LRHDSIVATVVRGVTENAPEAPNAVRLADQRLFSAARARLTFSRMSEEAEDATAEPLLGEIAKKRSSMWSHELLV
jgi:hypothetical protein